MLAWSPVATSSVPALLKAFALPLVVMVSSSLFAKAHVMVCGPEFVMLPEPGHNPEHACASGGLPAIKANPPSTAADTAGCWALVPTVALRLPRRFAVSGATRAALCRFEETLEEMRFMAASCPAGALSNLSNVHGCNPICTWICARFQIAATQ
jgi:hypothetical protein